MQLHWHTEPFLLISILFFAWTYGLFTGPFRTKIAPEEPYPSQKAFLFYLTLAGVYLTVGSPLDSIGEQYLFWVHMVQHMLLVYPLPMMILMSTPSWLIDAPLKKYPNLRSLTRFLTHPVIGGLAFTITYTLWHIPVLYESALQYKHIHIIEHWIMFGTSLLMLWPLFTPSRILPRARFGTQMIYIFLLMIGQIPVFAYLTFSGEVLYATYEYAPRVMPLNALEDQILGGILMKVVNMAMSLILFARAFYQWNQSNTQKTPSLA